MRTAEEWKRIIEFGTGLHYISSFGRVKRNSGYVNIGYRERFLTDAIVNTVIRAGYSSISRRVNGTSKNFPIHILVAKYFIPNPLNKKCVNHKDGNKLNNRVDNLEWVTHSENELHSYKVLNKKANKTALGKTDMYSPLSKKIKCIETGIIYTSLGAAAKDIGVSRGLICKVLKGDQKTAKQKTFQYL